MIKKILFVFITILLITSAPFMVHAEETAFAKTVQVDFSGGTREVKAVWVDMKNPLYRAEVVLAKNRIGQTDTLENIIAQVADNETEAIAAINGTFFNAYSDFQPVGTLQLEGRIAYTGNSGTVIGFSADNSVEFAHLYISVAGSVNGIWEYPYNWSVWGVNQVYGRSDANVLYTPDFGSQVDAGDKTAIIIRNKKVIDIRKGTVPIYSDGYTLVFGAKVYYSMFKIGDSVDYRFQYNYIDYDNDAGKGEPIQWSHIRTALGAGPMLLQNGRIVLDAQKEGFTDSKFSSRAQRSFIGVSSQQILIFGTVSNVTLKELAEIMLNMGIENGMNLDGGASSALYFKGNTVTSPSRKLSNVIVITEKKTRPIRLELNGKELFLDTDPYFENDTTMVPIRGIMEALGAEAGWDPQTGTIWARKGKIKVEMWNESDIVRVNGIEQKILAPIRVVYNRTHVPVRFMTELFGGEVEYDRERNMVVMVMDKSE